jgi:hypothetical protein
MEDITIKKIENGYLITQNGKSYVATNSGKILNQLLNKLLVPKKKNTSEPPPIPVEVKAAKKVALE